MKKSKIVTHRVVLCILTALMISFIFLNSALDADESSLHSAGLRELINSVLHSLNINIILTENFVRKTAHFVEFFTLGALLFATVRSFIGKLSVKILYAPLIGFVVACTDEFIQFFSPGRACQFLDMMVDLAGILSGFIVYAVIYILVRKTVKKFGMRTA